MARLLDLERARYAATCVTEAAEKGFLDRYAKRTKSAPAEVMENGLAQTLAFYQEKGGEYRVLARHLLSWLKHCALLQEARLPSLLELPSALYRRSTEEALAVLEWLKRLAAARKGEG